MQEINDEQKNIWALACLAAPVAHVASGLPWVDVCWVSLLGTGIRGWTTRQKQKFPWINSVIGILAAAQALELMENCWPRQRDTAWIMIILLILGVVQAAKGEKPSMQGGLLLWWLTAFLLGSVLVSAIPEIKVFHLTIWKENIRWNKIRELLILLLLPSLLDYQKKEYKTEVKLMILPIICSVCVQGVLSYTVAGESEAPFYELSRTIQLYGILERMEAMAWLGLMLGTYLYLSFLMNIAAGEKEGRKRIIMLLASAVAAKTVEIFIKKEAVEYILLTLIVLIYILSICMKIEEKIKTRKMKKEEKNS